MKTARLLIIALFLFPSLASAKCAWTWADSWNDDQPISPNDWVVVEAGGEALRTLTDIANRAPRLVSDGHSVPLRVMATHKGQMNRGQAVLKPSEPLRPGQTYRLAVKDIHSSLKRLTWRVEKMARGTASVTGAPSVTDKSRQRFGCGPAVYVELKVPTVGDMLGYTVEVTGPEGARAQYILRGSGGALSIGHGMCSGAFKLRGGQTYKIRVLSAITRTGRTVKVPGRALSVVAP